MNFAKTLINDKSHLSINLIFAFFPISFVLGSAIVNLNFLVFCCFGIFYLKSKLFTSNYNFFFKIIFLFFLVIIISTSINFLKSTYLADYKMADLSLFIKSLVFFRFFLFLSIVYLLNKFEILRFKYFFISTSATVMLVSLDVIFQSLVGFNILGQTSFDHLRPDQTHLINNAFNSGFFGSEHVAGSYIQRFSFFSIFFIILYFKNEKFKQFIFTILAVCIFGSAILASGNRMPLILLILGLFLFLLFNFKIRKLVALSLLSLIIVLSLSLIFNKTYQGRYGVFQNHSKDILRIITAPIVEKLKKNRYAKPKSERSKNIIADLAIKALPENAIIWGENVGRLDDTIWESNHRRLYMTAIDTWKQNKILGSGIKSFWNSCHMLAKQSDINIQEILTPYKKNRLCSNHPHNYYLQILSATGIIGFLLLLVFFFSVLLLAFKSLKKMRLINYEHFILSASIISLILELLPIRSSGSIFTTNNITYLILIASIALCHKKLLKN